jgi:hypothetical protein
MSESKFSGTLRRLKKTPKAASDPKPSNSSSVGQRPLTGHYRGKRSDPDWASTLRRKNEPHFGDRSRSEWLAGHGPLERLGEGAVEVGDEGLDAGLQVRL